MTPLDGLLTALGRGVPDRLSVMEMAIDWKVVRDAGASDYFDLVERLDLEGVSVNQVAYLEGLRGAILRRARTFTDPWGVRKRIMGELLPYAVAHPVRETARRLRGRRAVVFVAPADFAAAWNLCGMKRLLTCYLEQPGFARRISAIVLEYGIGLYRLAVGEGTNVVVHTDDFVTKKLRT